MIFIFYGKKNKVKKSFFIQGMSTLENISNKSIASVLTPVVMCATGCSSARFPSKLLIKQSQRKRLNKTIPPQNL